MKPKWCAFCKHRMWMIKTSNIKQQVIVSFFEIRSCMFSWVQSWRLVLMDQVQRDLRRWNQDERKESCSTGWEWRSCLSSFGGRGVLQHWPMPRLSLHFEGLLFVCDYCLILFSWLWSWRLVRMVRLQYDLRRWNQDERKGSCSRGRKRRSCLSGFGWRGALQYWPMWRVSRLQSWRLVIMEQVQSNLHHQSS